MLSTTLVMTRRSTVGAAGDCAVARPTTRASPPTAKIPVPTAPSRSTSRRLMAISPCAFLRTMRATNDTCQPGAPAAPPLPRSPANRQAEIASVVCAELSLESFSGRVLDMLRLAAVVIATFAVLLAGGISPTGAHQRSVESVTPAHQPGPATLDGFEVRPAAGAEDFSWLFALS